MKLHSFGHVQKNRAIISRVVPGGVFISMETAGNRPTECNHCSQCQPSPSKRTSFFPIKNTARFTEGQHVSITFLMLNEALAAAIAFGIPLICACLGFLIWTVFFSRGAESAGAILATVLALIGGFILAGIGERALRSFFPIIIDPCNGNPLQAEPDMDSE